MTTTSTLQVAQDDLRVTHPAPDHPQGRGRVHFRCVAALIVGMTVIDAHGNLHRPQGVHGAGQFTTKHNTAPAGNLQAAAKRGLAPQDVRCADYVADFVIPLIEDDGMMNVRVDGTDEDGNTIVAWSWRGYQGSVFNERMRIDPDGEILVIEAEHVTDQGTFWFDVDHDARERVTKYRIQVNEDRLRLAGIVLGGQVNDGGYSGNKFVGALRRGSVDAADVSKTTRAQIKEAVRWGALPQEYAYSVRSRKFAGGQAVDIRVDGMPDAKHYFEHHTGIGRGVGGHAREVTAALETIADQWNVTDVDSMRDFFNVSYYTHVDIPDEATQRFYQEQREIARRKRAEKKAAAA